MTKIFQKNRLFFYVTKKLKNCSYFTWQNSLLHAKNNLKFDYLLLHDKN